MTAYADLGFRDEDATDLVTAIARVRERVDEREAVATMADRLRRRVGVFEGAGEGFWSGVPVDVADLGSGVLPMLALLTTAPDVAGFHAARGVPADISTATLADLGQQVWVHRMTYQEFGLHTYGWLPLAWSGALYRLGRLQFNLERHGDGWILDTHVPRSGPLDPDSVDASFAAAREFFGRHFPECPVTDFVCRSWLLDPTLAEGLPDSNLAAFQRRWTAYGEPQPGEEDVLFFVFFRRGPVDVASLPTDTALRRLVVERLVSGHGWSTISGRLSR